MWGYPDAAGVRQCANDGCTVRVRDSYREWQAKKGGRWRGWDREPFPGCEGKAVKSTTKGEP